MAACRMTLPDAAGTVLDWFSSSIPPGVVPEPARQVEEAGEGGTFDAPLRRLPCIIAAAPSESSPTTHHLQSFRRQPRLHQEASILRLTTTASIGVSAAGFLSAGDDSPAAARGWVPGRRVRTAGLASIPRRPPAPAPLPALLHPPPGRPLLQAQTSGI